MCVSLTASLCRSFVRCLAFGAFSFSAYKTVLHSYGLDSNPSTDEEENSDLELMEVSCRVVNRNDFSLVFCAVFV